MPGQDGDSQAISPQQGWESIHATLDRSRSSMYVAGWTTIMLMWGVIVATGNVSTFAIETWASSFADDYPWFPGALWGTLGLIGMVGSSLIGHRASKRNASGPAATAAGIRVLAYWLTVVASAFAIPAASGLWTGDTDPIAIGGVAIGVIALGYVLFGILHHPAISAVGLGIAASYYLALHYAGDAAPIFSAILILAVVLVAWLWMRKDDVA